jgi:formylglycine-generating enzyme required for sulfatase activity
MTMNRVLAVLLGIMPLVELSWSAGHGQSGGDEPKATAPYHDLRNSIGMKLVLIPAGKFTMGSPRDEKGRREDERQRAVRIARPFYMGIYEVTQGEFEAVMGFNPSHFSAGGKGREGALYLDWSKPGGGKDKVKELHGTRNFPVENVSWDEAVEFCKKLSALPGEVKARRTYRLPSEPEWEYACRGGASSYHVFHLGDRLSSAQANFRGAVPYGAAAGPWLQRTCQVGSYKPNAFGLYDMHGNVWEWCADRYARDDDARVRRGGCWIVGGAECRSAVRRRRVPDDRRFNLGFRVVLEAPNTRRGAKALASLRGHTNEVLSLAITADGKTLVTGSLDRTIKVWDLATGRERATLRGHATSVLAIALADDGRTLASAGRDGVIKVWDLASCKERLSFDIQPFGELSIAVTGDGKTLASGGRDETVRLWNLDSGRELAAIHAGRVQSLAFAPDGRTLAIGGSILPGGRFIGTLKLWDVPTGQQWGTTAKFGGGVRFLAFAADGKTLASTNLDDATVRLWEVATGKERASFQGLREGNTRPAFTLDSGMLAAGGPKDGTVTVWDLSAGKALATLKGDANHVHTLAFTPDGNTLAAAEGPDTTIRLWDVAGLTCAPRSPSLRLSDKDIEGLWTALAGADACRAYRAVWSLTMAPGQTVAWLKQRLRPVPAVEPRVVTRLLVELNSPRFAVREKATHALESLGEAVVSELRNVLTTRPPPETRRRVERLLEKLDQPLVSGERLRALRAVEVLEHIGSPAARQTLERLAGGMPEARVTREAKASLGRLARR